MVERVPDPSDGSIRYLLRFEDASVAEAVAIPLHKDGAWTVCLSSQVGCAMRCDFCATGRLGLKRNLTAHEIVGCWLTVRDEVPGRVSGAVFMGQGEPFHNYDPVLTAIRRLMSDLGIGARHITVSTVGLVPRIQQFAREGLQVKLAISLHATQDEARSASMPVNRRYPIRDLIAACRDYVEQTNRRVTFEWALIDGQNDSVPEAHRLGRLLKGLKCHVNLIPLNPTRGYSGRPTGTDQAQAFIDALATHGVPATVRVRRGIDIDAGCGQLKSTVLRRRP